MKQWLQTKIDNAILNFLFLIAGLALISAVLTIVFVIADIMLKQWG